MAANQALVFCAGHQTQVPLFQSTNHVYEKVRPPQAEGEGGLKSVAFCSIMVQLWQEHMNCNLEIHRAILQMLRLQSENGIFDV